MSEALRRENAELAARLARLEAQAAAMLNRSGKDHHAIINAGHRFDAVGAAMGLRAPAATPVESRDDYRRRLLREISDFAPTFRGKLNVRNLEGAALDVLEDQVYNDAAAAAQRNEGVVDGTLLPIQRTDESGRVITTFAGDPLAWMAPFMGAGQVVFFNRNPKGNE